MSSNASDTNNKLNDVFNQSENNGSTSAGNRFENEIIEEGDELLEESASELLGEILASSQKVIESEMSPDEDYLKKQANAVDEPEIEPSLDFLTTNEKNGIQSDPTFVKLRTEYDKMYKIFSQSRKNEKMLMKKCRELTQELGANASKVLAALKLSQNDRAMIISSKKEIKKAWNMVEIITQKEVQAKEAIASLKSEVSTLRASLNEAGITANITPGASTGYGKNKLLEINMEQEETIKSLRIDMESMEETIYKTSQSLEITLSDNQDLQLKINQKEEENQKHIDEIISLKDLLANKKSDLEREFRAREKLETNIRQITDLSSKKDGEYTSKLNELKNIKEQLVRAEAQFREERQKFEKSEKETEIINSKLLRLNHQYDEQVTKNSRIMNDNVKFEEKLESWQEEYLNCKDQLKMVSKARDTLAKRIKAIQDEKLVVSNDRDKLSAVNASLHHDIDNLKKEIDFCNKQMDSLSRERDNAQKNVITASGATQKQFNIAKLAEQTQRNLEQEINGYKDEASKMRKLIFSLEKERDLKINESIKSEESLKKRTDEVQIKELVIFDSKKKIFELERKLKEQQVMYETVRTDRNQYSKNLIESQDEITEMTRKLKIMSHQIEQLKEEIASKENALIKEHFEITKLDKEKEGLSAQIAKIQIQFEESQQMIQNQEAEENKLRHIIAEADRERLRQKKEYNNVVQERDILGTQIIRRNDELTLLYEKIKIHSSTLTKGERQYRERLEDLRVLKLEIKKLRREKAILQTETQNAEGLRGEIFRLQREVLREKTRVKILEEELESPMNIHRWRKLSGSDPSQYELITKVQTLQKRLISKTEEVVEKEILIQQKEKMYKEIKEILQRQPGPEVLEELRIFKEAVKIKVRESKALASELNMYQSQVNEYRFEIEKLNRDIQELKKKYFAQRKKERCDRKVLAVAEKIQEKLGPQAFERLLQTPTNDLVNASNSNRDLISAEGNTIVPQVTSGAKFSGGGFNMSIPVKQNAPKIKSPPRRFERSIENSSTISGKEIIHKSSEYVVMPAVSTEIQSLQENAVEALNYSSQITDTIPRGLDEGPAVQVISVDQLGEVEHIDQTALDN